MKRWVVVRGAKHIWYQFWQESQRLPTVVWQRWGSGLAIALGLCALLSFGLTWSVRHFVEQGSLQAWDTAQLTQWAEAIPLNFARAITWESPGNLLGMVPVVTVFITCMIVRSQPLLAATMAMAYGLQFALVWIGWGYWNRSRPDLIADGVAASGLHSFPSGHTVVVITVYGLLAYLWGRASASWLERLLVMVLATTWIGLIVGSRLVLGAHWPTDVIVGIAIGLCWLSSVIVTLKRAESANAKAPTYPRKIQSER